MAMTITFGWWLIPLALTLLFFSIAICKFERGRGDYSFPEVWNGILLLIAAIPSLIAWLLWALIA